jgi:hypothetical protein
MIPPLDRAGKRRRLGQCSGMSPEVIVQSRWSSPILGFMVTAVAALPQHEWEVMAVTLFDLRRWRSYASARHRAREEARSVERSQRSSGRRRTRGATGGTSFDRVVLGVWVAGIAAVAAVAYRKR